MSLPRLLIGFHTLQFFNRLWELKILQLEMCYVVERNSTLKTHLCLKYIVICSDAFTGFAVGSDED